MTTGSRTAARGGAAGVVALVVAFVAIHLALGIDNVVDTTHNPAGDVTGVYEFWVDSWRRTGVLVGVDTDWVYPIGALVPILAAAAFGDGPYLVTFLAIVTVLDGVALLFLARRSRRLAWWWLALILLLGPVTLSRLDGVAMPITVVAAVLLADRPVVATVLLTVATWIKVWPAAMLAAILLVVRRIVGIAGAIVVTSAIVIGVALAVGARSTIFSFVAAQASRGLQIEAPIALPWLWSKALGDGTVDVYYDTGILTYQVRGDGVVQAAAAMTPALAIGVLAVVVLAIAARLRGVEAREVLAVTALGLVSAIIALNKVGSPQYITWYAAPVLLGLLLTPRSFRVPAVITLVIAGLMQIIYPWFYGDIVGTQIWAVAVLTLRNGLELALLGWSLAALAGARPPIRTRTGAVRVLA